MIKYEQIFDISVILGEQDVTYPDDPPFKREILMLKENGDQFELSALHMTSHAGTHIDFPSHFIEGGKSALNYPPERFVLPAHVFAVDDMISFSVSELHSMRNKEGEALLIKTDNSQSIHSCSREFRTTYTSISKEIADFCVDNKLGMLGFDYISVDFFGDEEFYVHKRLLDNDILILEGINLAAIEPGEYTLICLPLSIKHSEGSPVRAVLMK